MSLIYTWSFHQPESINMDYMLALKSLQTLPSFMAYFLAAVILLVAFSFLYHKFTPYNEMELIAKGNKAAAITLVGAMIGFTLPLASVIAHSASFVDMFIWALVAIAVQLGSFLVVRALVVKNLGAKIEDNQVPTALFVFGVSVCIGILNATCMGY